LFLDTALLFLLSSYTHIVLSHFILHTSV